ncbi:MAG: 6-phospho-beta-glucosidase [Microbacteriaceae bacterium]|nr:6-phospho-beta-glucosidase [Microbacteriaceae bacterium]
MRIAVIGGASTYTPELVDGIGRLGLPVDELALVDPDTDRLEVVAGLGRRILARWGSPCTVTTTTDVAEASTGAAAVLLQLRVGGQAARERDETWPLSCGCIGQETTGAGGLAKAMRTVPVVRRIAERVREVAPDAWIVDFTNPVGIVTRALLDDGHRAIGLCNVAIGLQRLIAKLLEVEPGAVELTHVGLNHLSWETGVTVAGEPVLPRLLRDFGDALVEEVELPVSLLRREGTIPSYYLRYFYEHDALVRESREKGSRAAAVARIERELLELYADPELDSKPELLAQRGGAYYSEAAVALLRSLLWDTVPARHVVNVRNAGTLPFLPDEAVIEVSAAVGRDGAAPLPVGEVPPLAGGLIAHTAAYEVLALDAARHGGRDRIARALLAHPLIGQLDRAEPLADLLLAENAPWLAGTR